MKSSIVTKTLVLCLLIAANNINAQNASAAKEQKVVKVCTLNSIQANQEFQRNVRLMQVQRQNIVDLKGQLDNEVDDSRVSQIQKDLDAALVKLNENNEVMFKTYGFSLTRNYHMFVEKAHVYMIVSDDEFDKFQENQDNQ